METSMELGTRLGIPSGTLGRLGAGAVLGLDRPSGLPFHLASGSFDQGLLAFRWEEANDFRCHELGVRGVGGADETVGLEAAQVAVGTGDAHVRVGRRLVDDVLHEVVVGNVGGDGWEDAAGLFEGGRIALGDEFGEVSLLLGGVGGVGFGGEIQRGHVLVEVGGWNTLPAAVGWLRDLGVVHGVGVNVVHAAHGRFAHFDELVVVGAG